MADIQFNSFYTGQVQAQRVFAKTVWADPWQPQPLAFCTRASWSCAPSISSAELFYQYGLGLVPANGQIDIVNPYSLPSLAYVKIEFDIVDYDQLGTAAAPNEAITTRTWYGVVGTLLDSIGGLFERPLSTNLVDNGLQTLPAVGLEWLLARDYITTAQYIDSQNFTRDATRPIDFNEGTRPNRHTAKTAVLSGAEAYLFSPTLAEDADWWSSASIVEYLVNTHRPFPSHIWQLDDPSGLLVETDDRPLLRTRNARRWDLLNRLMPRQRGLSFRVFVNADESRFLVRPITFAHADLELNGDPILKANPAQNTLEMSGDRSGALQLTTDAFHKYTRVRVRGGRAVYCFNASITDGNLETAWLPATETEYAQGASTLPDYPAVEEIAEREKANQAWRNQPMFEYVYSRFRLTQSFAENPVAKDGEGEGENDAILNPNDDTLATVFRAGVNVLPVIPLRPGVDPETVDPEIRPGRVDFEQPKAWFAIPSTGKWVDARHVEQIADNEGENDDDTYRWSAIVSPDSVQSGFRLRINGLPKHVVDPGFAALPEDTPTGGWNYQSAIFTVAIEGDHYCEATWPDNDPNLEPARERLIDVGPAYQLHHIAKDTVIGVNPDQSLQRMAASRWVRDDRELLAGIAQLAFQWYGQDRHGLTFATSLVTDAFEIGDMITEVKGLGPRGNTTVNSVITELTIESGIADGDREPPPPRISYRTNFAELDFGSL